MKIKIRQHILVLLVAIFMVVLVTGTGFAVWTFEENDTESGDVAENGYNIGVYVTSTDYQGTFEIEAPEVLILDVGVSETSLTTGINFFKQVTQTAEGSSNTIVSYGTSNSLQVTFRPRNDDYAFLSPDEINIGKENGTYHEANPGDPNDYDSYYGYKIIYDIPYYGIGDTTQTPTTNMIDVLSMSISLTGPIADILTFRDLYTELYVPESNPTAARRVMFGSLQESVNFECQLYAHRTTAIVQPAGSETVYVNEYIIVINNISVCLQYKDLSTKLTIHNYKDIQEKLSEARSALTFSFQVATYTA